MLKRVAAILLAMSFLAPALAGPAEDKALQDAAFGLDSKGVKAALQHGADPDAPSRTPRPFTPLGFLTMGMLAHDKEEAAGKALEIAQALFAAGAKLGPFDCTILYFPISGGNVPLVALLVEKGASVTSDLDGYSPTELAKKYGQQAVYEYLVSRGGIPVDSWASAQLALVEAASDCDIQGMERAIKDGAHINSFDSDNQTALIPAVRSPNFSRRRCAETVWWLLEHGADPNQKGNSNYQDLEGIPLQLLIAMNKYPIFWKEGWENRPELLVRMLRAGAMVSGMDSQGRTALHIAAKYDNGRAAEVLIAEGAKVMARDNTGKTPLDYAESASMIKLLKASGATER